MKRIYTKKDIVDKVKRFDKRASAMSEERIDDIINIAYSEVTAIVQAFSDEEIIDLLPFYLSGELKFTVDIEEDVSGVYDNYITIENMDTEMYPHGIKKIRDKDIVYQDNRYNGRIHVDLTTLTYDQQPSNLVVKYYYTPQTTSEDVAMDQQTWLCFTFALGTALYDDLHDVDRSSQKRAGLKRTALAILVDEPEDSMDPGKPSMFPYGV